MRIAEQRKCTVIGYSCYKVVEGDLSAWIRRGPLTSRPQTAAECLAVKRINIMVQKLEIHITLWDCICSLLVSIH